MVKTTHNFHYPTFSKRILIIVGGYGSGKSEVAVNLARHLAQSQERQVAIADLDVVNPYFRSREAGKLLEELGIKPLNPRGTLAHADLPIILPEVKAAIENSDDILILDVGGDDVGARVVGSLTDVMPVEEYELLLVLNANRPFTSTVENCRQLMGKIEVAGRLHFTGIIANTHMLEYTTPDTVREGLVLSRALSQDTGLPIVFVSAMEEQLKKMKNEELQYPVLPLERLLLKPWEHARARLNDRNR